MAKSIVTILILASAFAGVQAMGQTSGDPHPGFKASFLGSSVTCSQPHKQTEKFIVPIRLAKRAKLKAHLLNLLHESLSDDSKGIVNIEREKEISSLAKKLKDEKGD